MDWLMQEGSGGDQQTRISLSLFSTSSFNPLTPITCLEGHLSPVQPHSSLSSCYSNRRQGPVFTMAHALPLPIYPMGLPLVYTDPLTALQISLCQTSFCHFYKSFLLVHYEPCSYLMQSCRKCTSAKKKK
jgi:hypothetical protein